MKISLIKIMCIIVTSAEVIIAEYDAILGQWEREHFYNHLSNYTNTVYGLIIHNSFHCRKDY